MIQIGSLFTLTLLCIAIKLTGAKQSLLKVTAVLAVAFSANSHADTMYFVHGNHHGTPQVITNEFKEIVWKGEYKPYGKVYTCGYEY